jgi:hypothetical protein
MRPRCKQKYQNGQQLIVSSKTRKIIVTVLNGFASQKM